MVVIKTNIGIIVLIHQILIQVLFLLDRHGTVMITFTQQDQDMWFKSVSILQSV